MRKYNFKETENNLHEENRKTTSLLLKETKRNLLPRNKKFTFKKKRNFKYYMRQKCDHLFLFKGNDSLLHIFLKYI